MKQILSALAFALVSIGTVKAQVTTTCPAPNPGDPNCFQTTRPAQGNPLTNWPPLPNQDCCNAIPLCLPYNVIENGIVIPSGASNGVLYPGCIADELPSPSNTCFSNNEKGTTWFKFQIRPLNIPGSPTAVGSPAGKLRFKIIPKDVLALPNYNPFTDAGAANFGNTDFDFLLFKIPADQSGDGDACTAIRNSTAFGNPTSVIASCNWAGTRGPTGLFEPGTGTETSQGPATRFNLPLDVKVGDIFYLAIDNFSVNIQGFDVDFRGLEAPDDQTAIVNPPPTDSIKIKQLVNPVCRDRKFKMVFDKPVRCDSVKPGKFTVTGLLPNINIVSIQPEGGCNPGGQDTSFVFTLNIPANNYDTTMQLYLTESIRDNCGNKVLLESVRLRLEYPAPNFHITRINPSTNSGSSEFILHLDGLISCDSVRKEKFAISGLQPGLSMVSIQPLNGCNLGGLDSAFVFTISSDNPDTTLVLSVTGIIGDSCGRFLSFSSVPFRIEYPAPFIIQQPSSQYSSINSNAVFNVVTSDASIPRRWQMNTGTGFQNLDDVGQFSGTSTDVLSISSVQVIQNNTSFRCKFSPPGQGNIFSQAVNLFVVTSVYENESSQPVRLFPNPVKGESIHFTGSKISITDLLGHQVLSQINFKELGEINLGGLPNGVYFAMITDGGKVYISKLIVER